MNYNNLLSFYKSCYEADTRTFSLTNLLSAKVENRYFLEGDDEILNEHLPKIPLSSSVAQPVLENLSTYGQEKSLYLSAFFICGRQTGQNGKSNIICAPLFFYPATVTQEDDLFFLSIDKKLAFPNMTFLEGHRKDSSLEISELFNEIISGPLSFKSCGILRRKLESSFTQFDAEELLLYPKYMSESTLRSGVRSRHTGFKVYPAVALCVLKHSTATLGILSELDKMMSQADPSSSVKHFFDYHLSEPERPKVEDIHIPAILSEAQQNIIMSANNNSETVVIGPPGTGKSFTIATLAIDQLNRGKSVLIVSKTDQAVDVIHQKIEGELGIPKLTVRAGKKQHLSKLKERLKGILSGLPVAYSYGDEKSAELLDKISAGSQQLNDLIQKLYEQISDDLRWGEYLFKNKNGGIFSSVVKKYYQWLNNRQEPHWEIIAEYYSLKNEYIAALREYVLRHFEYQLWKTLKHHRKQLRDFLQAIRARTLSKQEALFAQIDFDIILKAFPIWVCKLSDLYEVLPLKTDMFDLVIIDEASQCDISSCLPALQRAKNLVVVGDPQQLRHYSFLSRGFIKHLREKHLLNEHPIDRYFEYRDASILDIYFEKIQNQQQIAFLDEHFRGNDSLISFSNEEFYRNRLKVIKTLPHHNVQCAVKLITTDGKRSKDGINEIEARQLLKSLETTIQNQTKIAQDKALSIGILSPFRSQTEFLDSLIGEQFDASIIQKHKIKVGTPYSFQGDERDIIYISFCVDDDTHHTAFNYLNTPEVFNVAITRAKTNQYIFSSLKKHSNENLLSKYVQNIQSFAVRNSQPSSSIHDAFMEEVAAFFEGRVENIYKDYPIAGILVDVLLYTERGYFGIDLIGYPGKFYSANNIDEYEILRRSGVKMLPLPYSNWYYDKNACQDGLTKIIFDSN